MASMLASVAAESVHGIGELSPRVPRACPFSSQQDEARRRIVTGMPRVDLRRHGREAMRRYGIGRARILEEITRLGTGRGFLGPSEYFTYRLYEPDRSFAEKLAFVGKRLEVAMHGACNARDWLVLANDKLITYAFLRDSGFPVPEIVAVFHPDRPTPPRSRRLADRHELEAFIRNLDQPLFGKPLAGFHSLGCLSIEGFHPNSQTIRLAFGEDAALQDFSEYVQRAGSTGYIFQERLQPHRELAKAFGPTLSTIRMMVLLTEHGPTLLRAACKIPKGRNFADNFWRGNMAAAVDARSGRLQRIVSGVGVDQVEYLDHPDTGQRLLGMCLPRWDDAVRICLEASACMPGLRTQSWDVAITDRGPVLVEVNSKGNFSGPQIASGMGILDEAYEAHLRRCGYRPSAFAKKLSQSVFRRLASLAH